MAAAMKPVVKKVPMWMMLSPVTVATVTITAVGSEEPEKERRADRAWCEEGLSPSHFDDQEPQRDGSRPDEPRNQALLEDLALAEYGPPRNGCRRICYAEKAHERHTADEVSYQDSGPTELADDIDPRHRDARVEDQIEEPESQDQPEEHVRKGPELGEGPRHTQTDTDEGDIVNERIQQGSP